MLRRKIGVIVSLSLFFLLVLSGCGNSQEDKVLGSYFGNAGSTLVIEKDNTITLDGGAGITKGKWHIEDDIIYITERVSESGNGKADIEAPIPSDKKVSALTFSQSDTGNGKWNTEIFTKTN